MKSHAVTSIVAAMAALGIAVAAMADQTTEAAGAVLKMKAGTCKFTLVQSDGIRPAAKAEMRLTDTKAADHVVTGKTDALGVCSLDVPGARYLMTVDGKTIGLIDTSLGSEVTEFRIILPASAAMTAGQDPVTGGAVGGFSFLGVQGGAGVALAGAVGAVAAGGVVVAGDELDAWDVDGIDDDNDDPRGPQPPTSP